MPRVLTPVTKPRLDKLAKLPSGTLVRVEVRKKLTRNSFTCAPPKVFVLLISTICARVGVTAGKPGTLAATIWQGIIYRRIVKMVIERPIAAPFAVKVNPLAYLVVIDPILLA